MLVEDFLSQSAERFPDKVAIVCGDQRLSFSAWDRLASQLANMLAAHGVCRGDRVAVLLDNSVDAAVAIFGILKAGAVFTVMSQTVKADKLAFIIDDCSASALITQPFFFDMVRTIDRDRRSLSVIVSFGADAPSKPLSKRVVAFDEHQQPARESKLGRRSSMSMSQPSSTRRDQPGSPKGSRFHISTSSRQRLQLPNTLRTLLTT